MNSQIVALIFVVLSFALLFTWVFWPSNKARFEAQGQMVLDRDDVKSNQSEGEKS
jgi:cbb3-type cytochrome oxidase subunit 3